MFEEICLVCGKHLYDYGSAYCSDDCQGRDATSPSISSSSSALSSPHLDYANGTEVPPLMPCALGTALKILGGREAFSLRSSKNSPSWVRMGVDDDLNGDADVDDDVGASLAVRAECGETSGDVASKQVLGYANTTKSSALQYTRRPSGTNNHSTVPRVHRRMSSTSSPSGGNSRGTPRSAPLPSHSSTEDDDMYSDIGVLSLDMTEESDGRSEVASDCSDKAVKVEQNLKSRRTRNRASLPACFSLLQMNSPKHAARMSPVSSSSGRTIAHPSPPTPKVTKGTADGVARGRRRMPIEGHWSEEEMAPRINGDWSSVPGGLVRGRTRIRRNSSGSGDGLSRPGSRRGRFRGPELGGLGESRLAPGFGNGRSGLVGRERKM